MSAYFITATDTDAGKTFVSVQLLNYWCQQGYNTLGFKPVASGCRQTAQGLQNDDALQIMAASSVSLPYSTINPYAFEPAIAPHIAAQITGCNIDIKHIARTILQYQNKSDKMLVEGVGGWLVPLNESDTIADLAALLNFPVILVVSLRLGCINQALLTAQAIAHRGLTLAGWIANNTPAEKKFPMSHRRENIDSLKKRLNAPFLGQLPCFSSSELNARPLTDFINIKKIENSYV